MIETEELEKNLTKDIKLYKSKSIGFATFLGGPLAAGYLISENFTALNKPDKARKALIIGIIATVVLFGLIFMIPETVIDKIPSQLIPIIYTGIILLIVENTQGDMLRAHEKNENFFYSGWRAAGISFISFLILLIGIFGYIYLESNNPTYEIYDNKIAKFTENENESLTFYDNIRNKSNAVLLSELDNKVIPKWEENIKIIKELNTIEDLPSDLLSQNKSLLTYSELRLKVFKLIKKAIAEDTDKYDSELDVLNKKIDNVLKEFNQE